MRTKTNHYKRLFAAGLIAPTILSNIAPAIGTAYAATLGDIVLNHDGDLQYDSNEDLKTFKVSFYYSYDDGTHIVETTEPIVIDVTEGDSVATPEIPKLKNHEFIGWDKDIPDTITGSINFHARYRYVEDDVFVNGPSGDTSDSEVSYNEGSLDTKKVLTEGVYMTQDEYEDYKKELNSFDITQMDDAYLEQLESDEANSLAMTLENSLIVSALPDDSSRISNIEDSEFVMDNGTFYPFRSFIGPYLQTHSGETSVDDNVGSVWMKVFKEETTWTGSGKWSDKYHVNDTDKGVQITYNIGYDDALARAIAPLNSKLLDNMAALQPGVLMQYMRDYKQHPQVMKAIVAHINAVQADKNSHGDDSVYLPVLYDKKHSVNERVYFLNALIHYYGSLNSKAQEKFSNMENELAVAYRQKDSRFQISRSETPEIYDLIARTEMSARPVYYKYDIDAMMTFHTDGKAKTMTNFLLQKTGDFDAAQTTNYHKEFFNYVVSTNKGIGRWMGYFDSTVFKKYDHQYTPANHIFDKTSSATGTQWIDLDSARDVFGGDGVLGGDVYEEPVTDPAKTDLYLVSMSQGLKDLVNQNSTTKVLYDAWYRKASDNNTVTISYNLNGGTNSTANPNSVNIFSDVTFASASRVGHTFGGWYVDSGLTKKVGHFYSGWTHRNDGVKTVPLYAKFTPNSYRLTINANGGTCSTGSIAAVVYNNTVNVANPTRTGYTFTGWSVSGAGSSISGTTFKMGHANATLTANWKINRYTVTINADGGTGGTSTFTADYNSTNTITPPTKSGYEFTEWTKSGAGTLNGNKLTIGLGNTTLTANWKQSYYVYHFSYESKITKTFDYKFEPMVKVYGMYDRRAYFKDGYEDFNSDDDTYTYNHSSTMRNSDTGAGIEEGTLVVKYQFPKQGHSSEHRSYYQWTENTTVTRIMRLTDRMVGGEGAVAKYSFPENNDVWQSHKDITLKTGDYTEHEDGVATTSYNKIYPGSSTVKIFNIMYAYKPAYYKEQMGHFKIECDIAVTAHGNSGPPEVRFGIYNTYRNNNTYMGDEQKVPIDINAWISPKPYEWH